VDFSSDNAAGVHPAILEALARANDGTAAAYGEDGLTKSVTARINEIFERECAVFFVATGSAANALALSVLCPPYGAVLCHEDSHIECDECNAPEFFTGGAKLVTLSGEAGKLSPRTIEAALGHYPAGFVHHAQPRAVSLTQASEWGTVYSPDEIAAIAEVAKTRDLKVHMDGARFANALVGSGASPAALTWKAGVDVLSFGATKNGALAAEAVIFFDPDLAGDFVYRRKRGGHLISKGRYLAAQFEGYLAEDLWLEMARHANAMARELADGLVAGGARLCAPVQANEIFAVLPAQMEAGLAEAGAKFYPWVPPGDTFGGRARRFVTSFATRQGEIDQALAVVRAAA